MTFDPFDPPLLGSTVALYLSADRIAQALRWVGNSRAKAGLLDFLIVKRTLQAKETTGGRYKPQSEAAYIQALDDLASCGTPSAPNPYINIFLHHR